MKDETWRYLSKLRASLILERWAWEAMMRQDFPEYHRLLATMILSYQDLQTMPLQ